jgi:uncharacterized protein
MLRMCIDGRPEAGLPVWRLNMIHTLIMDRYYGAEDDGREIPLLWSIIHMYTTTQLAKIFALKRGLNPELAGLVCVFHDIYTLITGETKNHGIKGESYVREIIGEYNEQWGSRIGFISDEEIRCIVEAIIVHSDKTIVTENQYTELLKDIDSIDSYLHGLEPLEKNGRLMRVNKMLKEI